MDKKLNNLIKKNLEELKAIDTKILDLSQIDAFTDQLIITTGTSKPHITAISKKITDILFQKVLKTNQIKVYGYEGRGSKDWVLIDLGEVVLNIMSSSARELYDLESLWDPNL